jgi:hypothetical protein
MLYETEVGNSSMSHQRKYRRHCGNCGLPFDGQHNQSCPHCEEAAYAEYERRTAALATGSTTDSPSPAAVRAGFELEENRTLPAPGENALPGDRGDTHEPD